MTMDEIAFQKALDAAFRFLSPRPRSILEVRQRLRRRGLEPEETEEVVAWLQEREFVDDMAFANFWIENRESFRPRARRMIEQELRQRGVNPQALEARLETVDEEASAARAAGKKAQSLASHNYATFTARIGGLLRRRGFSYEIVSRVTRRLWTEVTSGSAERSGRPGHPDGEDGQD
ncbi:MAG: regulatory protein RecX [Dehalococcoidia bacterium]|nr:regulatory protein RecX [Dehalococcoidia bacterium]